MNATTAPTACANPSTACSGTYLTHDDGLIECFRCGFTPNGADYVDNAPQCITPGCTRDAEYDGESGGHFSACGRCGLSVQSGSGLHAHRHHFTPAQEAANGGPRSWVTATTLHPVVQGDEVTAWECREPLPNGRGGCDFTISREEIDARAAHRQGDHALNEFAWSASNGHQGMTREQGAQVWATYKALRDAYSAQHPADVR
jgi:hypothetical protein